MAIIMFSGVEVAKQFDKGQLILAAGGIVERALQDGFAVAVIYREIYGGEWSLPKGKQDPGETLQQTALREVLEETGCEARLTGFAGCTHYYHGKFPKVVLYWRMETLGDCDFKPSGEVLAIEWVSPGEAVKRLAYDDEKDLLKKLYEIEL